MSFGKTLNEYMEKFRDSPPIFGLPEDMATARMQAAIRNGMPDRENNAMEARQKPR